MGPPYGSYNDFYLWVLLKGATHGSTHGSYLRRLPTFHGDVVHGELQVLPPADHVHRVPLVVVELLAHHQHLGTFTWRQRGAGDGLLRAGAAGVDHGRGGVNQAHRGAPCHHCHESLTLTLRGDLCGPLGFCWVAFRLWRFVYYAHRRIPKRMHQCCSKSFATDLSSIN